MMETYDYSTICRHVETETETITCEIKGTIPSWLNGFVLFNGPGLTKIGSSEYKHAFDSSALLQKIGIEDGKITYKTKFVQSNTFKKNDKTKSITVGEFGTPGPSSKGVLSRLMSAVDSEKMMSDNALLGVVKMGKRFYALGESPFFIEIDPISLDVISRTNMNKAYSLATQSIHVQEDEEGFYYTVGQAISITGPKYSILKFPKDGNIEKGKSVTTLAPRWRLNPSYIHSMAFTENYAVLVEPPLAVSIMELLSDVITNTPFIEGLHWHNEQTKFHILDRRTWKPIACQYVSEPFFFLHFSGAFERENHIVVDFCSYKDSSILNKMFIEKLRAASKVDSVEFFESFCSVLKRFVIPLEVKSPAEKEELVSLPNTKCSAKKVKNEIYLEPEVFTDLPFENPAVNKKFSKNGNRFVWGMGACPHRTNMGQIIKIDMETKETLIFKEKDLYPSPLIFVPSPDAQNEDDGVILALLLNGPKETLFTFLILEAATLKELCRAVADLKTAFSMPLHGAFFETTQL